MPFHRPKFSPLSDNIRKLQVQAESDGCGGWETETDEARALLSPLHVHHLQARIITTVDARVRKLEGNKDPRLANHYSV